MDNKEIEKIAARNDALRKRIYFPPEGDKVVLTPGVQLNPDPFLAAVRDFDSFDTGNDPYGEHDFGAFEVDGKKCFFKIDYYNADLSRWGDPLSEDTRRVLTVMRASEY